MYSYTFSYHTCCIVQAVALFYNVQIGGLIAELTKVIWHTLLASHGTEDMVDTLCLPSLLPCSSSTFVLHISSLFHILLLALSKDIMEEGHTVIGSASHDRSLHDMTSTEIINSSSVQPSPKLLRRFMLTMNERYVCACWPQRLCLKQPCCNITYTESYKFIISSVPGIYLCLDARLFKFGYPT